MINFIKKLFGLNRYFIVFYTCMVGDEREYGNINIKTLSTLPSNDEIKFYIKHKAQEQLSKTNSNIIITGFKEVSKGDFKSWSVEFSQNDFDKAMENGDYSDK